MIWYYAIRFFTIMPTSLSLSRMSDFISNQGFCTKLIEDQVVAADVVRENNATKMMPIKKLQFMV